MRLTFRQGILRVNDQPTFLVRNPSGSITLLVSNDPIAITFAHRQANYVVEELRTVTNAWNPAGPGPHYLYWDVDLLTASVSYDSTKLPIIINATAPTSPAQDQHWFDLTSTNMKVWKGSKWQERIRVFAGQISAGGVLSAYSKGSQVGLMGTFTGGSIVFDSFGRPLRQSYPNDFFVTTDAPLTATNYSSQNFNIEGELLKGMAAEYMPAYSAVMLLPGGKLQLARSADPATRICGVVQEDLYNNETAVVKSHGIIRNEQWAWAPNMIGKPVFSGQYGEITPQPPQVGVVQQLGFIYDQDSVFITLRAPVVLTEPAAPVIFPPEPPPPTLVANSANLTLTVDVAPTMQAGADTQYTFTVNNLGPLAAETVTVKLVLTQVGGGEVQVSGLPGSITSVYSPGSETTSIKVPIASPISAGTSAAPFTFTITAPLGVSSINVLALVSSPTADANNTNNMVGSTIVVEA
jgi:hypothetical protein